LVVHRLLNHVVFFHIISSAYIGMQKNRNYFCGGPWGDVDVELQPIGRNGIFPSCRPHFGQQSLSLSV
jgi:hypothetical protein